MTFLRLLTALTATFLIVSPSAAPAKEEAKLTQWQLKFLPVSELLPVATDALARLQNVELDRNKVKQDVSAQGDALPADPVAVRVGTALLVSDPKTNSLIFSGDGRALKVVTTLVKELDVRATLVQVSVVVAEVQLGKGVESALTPMSAIKSIQAGDAEIPLEPAIGKATARVTLPDAVAARADAKKLRQGFLQSYTAQIEAHPGITVLSRPIVTTASGGMAVISSGGQRIRVPVGGGDKRVAIDSLTLELETKSLVNDNGEIILDLKTTIQSAGEDNAAKKRNEIATRVTLPDGGIIALGGIKLEDRKELLLLAHATVIGPDGADDPAPDGDTK